MKIRKGENPMTYKIEDVANWFLAKDEMSKKKLQKLLYYAYSWLTTVKEVV